MIANDVSHFSKAIKIIYLNRSFKISTLVVFGYRIGPTCEQLR